MINIITTILFFLIANISFSSVKIDENGKAKLQLKLNNEILLTDTTGVFNVKNVVDLNVGDFVKIYLIDGKIITGAVTSVETVGSEILKIYGKVTNDSDAAFGFIINKKGEFGGAVIYQNKKLTYKLVYSSIVNGYVLLGDKLDKYN